MFNSNQYSFIKIEFLKGLHCLNSSFQKVIFFFSSVTVRVLAYVLNNYEFLMTFSLWLGFKKLCVPYCCLYRFCFLDLLKPVWNGIRDSTILEVLNISIFYSLSHGLTGCRLSLSGSGQSSNSVEGSGIEAKQSTPCFGITQWRQWKWMHLCMDELALGSNFDFLYLLIFFLPHWG